MTSFWEFFSSFLANIPEDLASNERLLEEELPNPKRLRFHLDMPPELGDDNAASRVHAALRTLASIFNNWDDVANIADLQGFPELDFHAGAPPCIS
jgi:hypothetical protein